MTSEPRTGRPWGLLAIFAVLGLLVGVVGARVGVESSSGGSLADAAQARGLSGDEAEAALATFVPPGEHDEYLMFSSGGHSGQLHVIGVPSMRLLKTIPVFSPDAWSGYGFGADWGESLIEGGSGPGQAGTLTWGDTHHPALSETDGDYDGRFIYINDRANGRLAMVDLRDFKTKQIIDIPNLQTSHGGVFATPNTDYVVVSAKTPSPFLEDDQYADLSEYEEKFRGVTTFVSVDQETGKGDLDASFQIELPPYNQDLADAGKGASEGWAFLNSYNTEMATGGSDDGNPPLETGAIANDFDFLHIVNWEKAAEVVEAGKYEVINGVRMIRLDTAIEEELLWFAPEPRNPHGVDVSPDGNYITVSGKLDPNATVYSIERIEKAIADGAVTGTDPYGVPILDFDAVVEAQVELGGGPLHTQYDDEGNAYTSLFVESAIAKWSLGPKAGVAEKDSFKLLDKTSVHYNVGHLVTAHGDTAKPHGKYLVSLNKWSVDRFPDIGTLHPQNFQLVDISGEKLKLLSDMPIGFGEPHYVQMMAVSALADPWSAYPTGTDPLTMGPSDKATAPGEERVVRDGEHVEIFMTAKRSHFLPDVVRVKEGDHVVLHVTNVETAKDATHGFAIPGYNKQVSLDPGEVVSIEFTADRSGSFGFYCTEFCSALHLEMQGWLLVEP
jgi:nitrous-oxide reductase